MTRKVDCKYRLIRGEKRAKRVELSGGTEGAVEQYDWCFHVIVFSQIKVVTL